MKESSRSVPRCVQWAGAILIALPIFDLIVAIGALGLEQTIVQWPLRLGSTALFIALAVGLVLGINLVRLLFAGLLLLSTATRLWGWYYLGAFSYSVALHLTWLIAPYLSLALCFLPGANRYFARQPVDETSADPAVSRHRVIALGVLAILVLGGVLHFLPGDSGCSSPGLREEHERIMLEADDLRIINNCRVVTAAMHQYFLEHPDAKYVAWSDLVGPNRMVGRLVARAGEIYPAELTRHGRIVVERPDGSELVYDPDTGRGIRMDRAAERRAASASPGPDAEATGLREVAGDPVAVIETLLKEQRPDDAARQQRLFADLKSAFQRGPISNLAAARIQTVLEDASVAPVARELILFALYDAQATETTEFLVRLATTSREASLRAVAAERLMAGDDPTPSALERLWSRSPDERVLNRVAEALAQHGSERGTDLLLDAALASEAPASARKRAASGALSRLSSSRAISRLEARLRDQPPASEAAFLIVPVLARMNEPWAARVLINWLQMTNSDAHDIVLEIAAHQPFSASTQAMWNVVDDPRTTFQNEANRTAVRRSILHEKPPDP